MIARIIEMSVRNRLVVALLTLALVCAGVWSILRIRLDAIPDLSDVQVIVTAEFPGQNPEIVDQQVTYPLASALLSVPGATVVRGVSMYEQSFVYVLFEDGTDIYWARARVLEYLNFAGDRLPKGVDAKLGPDATGVGWVLMYALKPGYYSKDHPNGLWRDPSATNWYVSPDQAPPESRKHLVRVRTFDQPGKDPFTGSPLVAPQLDLAQLRSVQDWYLRSPLTSVEGVSEVAPFGGFVRQYQVVLDPVKLRAFGLPLPSVITAIQRSNNELGGSVLEQSETEYMVRSRGYLRGLEDLAKVPVGLGDKGVPIMLADVASLQLGGESRRGISELNGEGEAVGGIIVARFGANAHKVIADVKTKLSELEEGLPPGVSIAITYDRSSLITRAVHTLRDTLVEEILVVGLVCIFFLLHLRSELVAVFVVPASVVVSLLVMHLLGMNANIMSLGGIAISIGVVVDSAIVMVENAHKHLDREEERMLAPGSTPRPRADIMLEAAREVGPQLFFSLLIITVSFVPVFVLEGEAGRLFKPLAFTKTFAMAAAAILSITIIPVLMCWFISARVLPARWGRVKNTAITLAAMLIPAAGLFILCSGMDHLAPYRWWIAGGWSVLAAMLLLPQRIIHEHHSPLSHILRRAYEPLFRASMRHPLLVLLIAAGALASTWLPLSRIGTEFMPPLNEGDLLYMPTTDPAIGIGKSKEVLQQTDRLIKTFPEVLSVHGKSGRALTATDPAPLSMLETVIQLNPDPSKWRMRPVARFFDQWPGWLRSPLGHIWPATRPITTEELKYGWTDPDGTPHPGLNSVVSLPGVRNAWLHPIETRIGMLATGIKTPVGIKILGPDLKVINDLAEKVAAAITPVPGTTSAVAERAIGGHYLDIDIDRTAAARYGLTISDVQEVIQTAVGGMNATTTVEGLERYPVNVRYARDFRDDIPALQDVIVMGAMPRGGSAPLEVPLGQLATFKIVSGAPMIRSENAQRSAFVYVDVAGRDLGGYINEARRTLKAQVPMPAGYSMVFAGQFEFWEKAVPRLTVAGLLALVAIVFLLYCAGRSWFRVAVVMLAVPFSAIGAFWFMDLMDYNLSLASAIGMIALAGLDAETGMVMLLYLENSLDRRRAAGPLTTDADLRAAVHDGAVNRIRPKAMTVAAAFIGLVPLLWADGSGSDTMRRIAAPMIGGLLVSFVMELIAYPVVFYTFKRSQLGIDRHQVQPTA